MRAVHVTLAATALAAPPSAFALAGAQSAPRPASSRRARLAGLRRHGTPATVDLRVSRRRVTLGRTVRFTGNVARTGAGERVALERGVREGRSRWRTVAGATVGQRGRFSFRVHPRRSAIYRAVLLGQASAVPAPDLVTAPSAAPASAAAPSTMQVSHARPVTVTPRFALTRRTLQLLGGGRIHVVGRLLPGAAGRAVVLERHTDRGWRTVASARTGRRGGFGLRWRPTGGAPARLRVLFAGDADNGRSTRAVGDASALARSVASWYYDAGATACGFHATYGVANRTLPCGTRVPMRHDGRSVVAVVDDRGPFVAGRDWDLSQTTAAALGFAGVGTIWVGG
ncbi:MAG: RlpA-like double-psi beta-barrel domain-containing protein [Solirubrobacteraceae bacterium]